MTFLIIVLIIIFILVGKHNAGVKSEKQAAFLKKYKTINAEPAKPINVDNKTVSPTIKVSARGVFGPTTSNYKTMDESIIDVGSESVKISSDFGLESIVPYWSHSYVYSYNEINYATAQQKKFYHEFKSKFLAGEYVDLEGNTNYAFILLFDLLNEFERHKDVAKLESHIETLGRNYPKTKSYGIDFLIKKMQTAGDVDGIDRLREDHYDYGSQVTYSTFEWRNKYKKVLGLKKDETNLLDKIWYSSNTFVNIDYCCISVIKLYLAAVKELQQKCMTEGTTISKQFEEVADVVARKHFKYRKDSGNYKYAVGNCQTEFYTNIFRYCENCIRELYGHKRKITIETYLAAPEANVAFEAVITIPLQEIFSGLKSEIDKPDEATELILNLLNTTRWKIPFESICSDFNNNPAAFSKEIIALGELNSKNPSIENIFFEASKFIAKYDQKTALSLYIYYLHHDMQSVTFDNKQLAKTVQKSLFKNEEQLVNFRVVVDRFIKEKNLAIALESIDQVYAVKRKKIQLDVRSIKEVQQQHSGTVELLNEYLKDDSEDITQQSVPLIEKIEEVEISIAQPDTIVHSIYLPMLSFQQIHTSTLEVFSKNNFSMLQTEFEDFAKGKGAFKNQLIERINEICYDTLDDLLIEEDEEYYTINQDYYQKLLAS